MQVRVLSGAQNNNFMKLRLFSCFLLFLFIATPLRVSAQVAKIGENTFATFDEALGVAKDGETITLIADVIYTGSKQFPANITLDLGTFTLDCTASNSTDPYVFKVGDGCEFTIKGNGTLKYSGERSVYLIRVDKGTLNIEGGTITSPVKEDGVIWFYAAGILNMTGGKVENTDSSKESNPVAIKLIGNANITGGIISAKYAAIMNGNTKTSTPTVKISDNVIIKGGLIANFSGKYTSVPKGQLIFVRENTTSVNSVNAVAKTCSYLELTDNRDFWSDIAFTATKSSYTRKMANTWGTLCLPFEIDITKSKGVEFYGITGVNEGILELSKYAINVPSGTPVVIKKTDSENETITVVGAENTAISCSPKSPKTSSTNQYMYGVFNECTIQSNEDVCYYYIANNKFYSADVPATINPYRAYFTLDAFNPDLIDWAPSPTFVITVSNTEITDVSSVKEDSDSNVIAIYGLDGLERKVPQQGINILKMSNGVIRKLYVR